VYVTQQREGTALPWGAPAQLATYFALHHFHVAYV